MVSVGIEPDHKGAKSSNYLRCMPVCLSWLAVVLKAEQQVARKADGGIPGCAHAEAIPRTRHTVQGVCGEMILYSNMVIRQKHIVIIDDGKVEVLAG